MGKRMRQHIVPTELKRSGSSHFYKHIVPTGLKSVIHNRKFLKIIYLGHSLRVLPSEIRATL